MAEALRAGARRLAATSDTARLDAELLMAHALGMSRSDMLLRAMDGPAPETFAALVDRRAHHEPVAYITGEAEFYGLPLRVSPAVLIPRGDSEVVVEAALQRTAPPERVLDLGTGSGALLLAVLAAHKSAKGTGIDASQDALDMARANARRCGDEGRTRFLPRNWREEGWEQGLGTFDLIVCNPPYVEETAQLSPDVRNHEPASALFAGPDGLDDYRILIPQLRALMEKGATAVLEIGAQQAAAVTELAETAGFRVVLTHDLANRPRCLVLS